MADLGGFADQARPVMADLNRSGDDVSRMIKALGPFSRAAQPSLRDPRRRPGAGSAGAAAHAAR